MKITIVSKNKNKCVQRLIEEALELNISCECVDFSILEDALNYTWGNFVIWRNSSLAKNTQLSNLIDKTIILDFLEKKKIPVLNIDQNKNPLVIYKDYQQGKLLIKNILENSKYNIPTFKFKDKKELIDFIDKESRLKLPIIEKPSLGSQGTDVRLIKQFSEIENTQGKIYQNFIENDGDYRVICLGGKVLGCIKRTGQDSEFRNNLSLGGKADLVSDPSIISRLSKIALSISSEFNLSLCGVDIIFNKEDKQYYFLEINTLVWWEGFENETKINVSKAIIENCLDILDRQNIETVELVKRYYEKRLNYLPFKTNFHFNSRYYLWTNSQEHFLNLKKMEKEYIGITEEEITEKIASYINKKNISEINETSEKAFRKEIIRDKYPNLEKFNSILFRYIFSKNIYSKNIKNIIKAQIETRDLIRYREELYKNPEDTLQLSTPAINFLYIVDQYLNDIGYKKYTPQIKTIWKIPQNYIGRQKENINIKNIVYYYTHCIINASNFYNNQIKTKKTIYKKMALSIENIILDNFYEITLDNKLEFLTCCRILKIKSKLENQIRQEAESSLSPIGNYIVDTFNKNNDTSYKKILDKSEHRNILYILAFTKSKKFD